MTPYAREEQKLKIFLKSFWRYDLFSAYTIKAPYLRVTPGHYAIIGEKDTLFKDREPPKTRPYPAARTYIADIGE